MDAPCFWTDEDIEIFYRAKTSVSSMWNGDQRDYEIMREAESDSTWEEI